MGIFCLWRTFGEIACLNHRRVNSTRFAAGSFIGERHISLGAFFNGGDFQ